jgi:hypothetical protein
MVDLNGHEAGNGGYGQGRPHAGFSSTRIPGNQAGPATIPLIRFFG